MRAAKALGALGYATTQTQRAPERDAEFFEYLLRDVVVSNHLPFARESSVLLLGACVLQSGAAGRAEAEHYAERRAAQRDEDIAKGVREAEGRQIVRLPQDFLYITRYVHQCVSIVRYHGGR